MDEQTLRHNGGNTLFLKNYEKGLVNPNEFFIVVCDSL